VRTFENRGSVIGLFRGQDGARHGGFWVPPSPVPAGPTDPTERPSIRLIEIFCWSQYRRYWCTIIHAKSSSAAIRSSVANRWPVVPPRSGRRWMSSRATIIRARRRNGNLRGSHVAAAGYRRYPTPGNHGRRWYRTLRGVSASRRRPRGESRDGATRGSIGAIRRPPITPTTPPAKSSREPSDGIARRAPDPR